MYIPKSTTVPLTRENINEIPTTNGVYIFKKEKTILYIGKSVNLKARLLSHLENAKLDSKEAGIINNADSIEYILTDAEFKALLLESYLIQEHRPKYNVRWMDDKSYLYIKITKEQYPKIYAVRRENDGVSTYIGPFPSIRSIQEILRDIRKIVPFCTQRKLGKQRCFYAKIGQCDPCPSMIEQEREPEQKQRLQQIYRSHINKIARILNGETDAIMKEFFKQIKELTENQQYEEAIVVRNKMHRLERLIHRDIGDSDSIQFFNKSEVAMKQLLAIVQPFFPELVDVNRIECFDISNLAQREATASMVVMTEGLIDKKEYKKFRIKNEALQSDFEMLEEVLTRRLKHITWPLPSLLVIDGGKPQIRTIQGVLQKLSIRLPLIGIAKNPDRFVMGTPELPTKRPEMRNLGFNLIRSLRDESHRFAKKYHVELRTKKQLTANS